MTTRAARVADTGAPTGRLVPSPFVRSALHGDRTILLDLRRERYYSLDEVGTRVWALLGEGADVPVIVARVAKEFEAPQERVEADLIGLLQHLSGLQVIVPAGVVRSGDPPATHTNRVVPSPSNGPLNAPAGVVCALVLLVATVGLRVIGLRRSLAAAKWLTRRAPVAGYPAPEFLADVVRKVDTAAAFFPGRALCLEQSLALHVCLRRAGVPTELRIGVQPYPFAAHAWVECQGELVGDSHDRVGKFVPFEDLEVS